MNEKHRLLTKRFTARALLLLAALVVAILLPQLCWATPINIGSISAEPAAEIKKFLPFAIYLAQELQSEGIDQGKVVVARNISQMAAFLREGKVDVYIDSPFPALAASHLAESKLILRRWKKGVAEYYSVIFAKRDSGINRLEDLKGKIIAFDEPSSTTGYFLPKAMMRQRGLKLSRKDDPSEAPAPGEVGYIFAHADVNVMVWVLRDRVAAGATDDQSYEKDARANLSGLKVIEKSYPIPRQVVSHRADLPQKLIARIKGILLHMDQSEEGKKVLQQFENTTKFDELSKSIMAPIVKAANLIPAELGIK